MSREELKKVKQSLWESAIKLRVGLEFEEEKKNFPEQLAQDEDYLRNWYISHNALYLPEETH
ncbi:11886_t:CDS:2 [Entrophospora sp. SA101]|nr:12073_t:CDS:2 [Entrophospora sp. SA101]CAJ0754211.1 22675_t:CDS:2 [Entrophospora sp. SA101]CAJ0767031.1 11886_t:CDS:2 [Entrophospora sp. SA101]CAJ0845586.1 9388_t:CDS:2 [Entrophospora sp. SA101]